MLKFLFLLGVALQPFLAMGLESLLCPEGFTYNFWEGRCYKDFSVKVSWEDALSICGQLGSHLMTMTSEVGMKPLKATECPAGFTYYGLENKCYKAFTDTVNWETAQKMCAQEHSHLVTIPNDESLVPLNKVVFPVKAACMNMELNQPVFWTAGKRKNNEFFWVPYRGAKIQMQYTNWCPGEPNNVGGNEDCLHFQAGDSKLLWYDSNCGVLNCFVCEVDL